MFDKNIQAQYVCGAVAAAALLGAGLAYRRHLRDRLPTTWTLVGSLDSIYIYPIKSCAPVTVDSAQCTYLGLKHGWLRDRVLMVVDEKNNFISAVQYPELLLVKPSVKSSVLTLRHVDMETLTVNLAEVMEEGDAFNATVWGCHMPVLDCGRAANEWLSKVLSRANIKFRLVYYSDQKCRELKTIHNTFFYKFRDTDTGAFADDTSFNLINNASVGDLSARLRSARVDRRHFRANLAVAGAAAFDEDEWQYVKIGGNVFEVIKPCVRCALTTVNPDTGVGDPSKESLEVLKSYRQFEDPLERRLANYAPRMGLLLALRSPPGGSVALRDPVYASYK